MESAIRDHLLWANATNQEIDHALKVKPCHTDHCFSPSFTRLCFRRPDEFFFLLSIMLVILNLKLSKIPIKENIPVIQPKLILTI